MPKQVPPELIHMLNGTPGFEQAAFEAVHASGEKVTSVRFNPAKLPLVQRALLTHQTQTQLLPESKLQSLYERLLNIHDPSQAVPWCSDGFYLPERPSFTFDPFLHGGLYYVQEASSMFLHELLRQIIPSPSPEVKVLDLCAAPGGKSSLLAAYFTEGLLVANEVIRQRAAILVENLSKWGSSNVLVTNNDPKDFAVLEGYFDVIVVDAPCSGSGLFRKDEMAMDEWSPQNVALCSQRQQRILADVLPALKEGGLLIYATCSYSREEDEDMLDWLAVNFPLQSERCVVPQEWGIVAVQSRTQHASGYRFFPDKVQGEGFFIAALRKTSGSHFTVRKPKLEAAPKQAAAEVRNWLKDGPYYLFSHFETLLVLPAHLQQEAALLQQHLYVRKAGVAAGELKGKDFIPHHQLALSLLVKGDLKNQDLSLEQALQYLRKKELDTVPSERGWLLASYCGIRLGWMKALGNRINNYYPTEWRILKQ